MRFYTRQHQLWRGEHPLRPRSCIIHESHTRREGQERQDRFPQAHRSGVAEQFSDPDVSMSVKTDLELIDHYDQLLQTIELHDISRFPTVGDFVSYCRLVACARESAGKQHGTSGRKIGNMHRLLPGSPEPR
jgi:transposase